jgi:hypothetical protein
MNEQTSYFDTEEQAYLSRILRSVFEPIPGNELLEDFLKAIDEGDTIVFGEE